MTILLPLLIWPSEADGQLLFRFEATAPRMGKQAGGQGGAGVVATVLPGLQEHPIKVNPDLLRKGPPRLELPTPGGTVFEAELTAFEDRGAGNVSWAGRIAGATHETVVLTLEDGYLIGSYGEPGRFKFEVAAEGEAGFVSDAGEVSAALPRMRARECGARAPPSTGPRTTPPPANGTSSDRLFPAVVESPQTSETTSHRIEVLVLYTQGASTYWTVTDAAAVQAAIDYTNSVWRNGALDATLHLAHAAPAPAQLSTAARSGQDWLDPIDDNAEVKLLRETHEADAVLLFMHDGSDWARCGAAYLRLKDHTPETISPWALGFANLACHSSSRSANSIFAHELGHILGGNHDPEGGGNAAPEDAVFPYAFGHTDTAPDPDVATIMSYGTNNSVREPYFSTVRVSPNGSNLGIANQRENERAIKQTVGSATEMSDWLPPAPPSDLTGTAATTDDGVSVSLTWHDNSSGEDSFDVQYRTWLESWSGDTKTGATLAADTTSATLTGLAAATRYVFRVAARNTHGVNFSNVWSVRTPGDGPPTAPTGLAGAALDSNSVRLTWTDNAVAETGYEVQFRSGTAAWTTKTLPSDSEAGTVAGLTAGTAYTFRVGAKNSHGTAFGDAAIVSTGVPAAPTGLVATASGSTSVTLNWVDNSSDETGFLIQYRASGGTNWTNYPTDPAPDATSASVTGLTAGAHYEFRLFAKNGTVLSLSSNVASLGSLGAPSAASGLAATGADSTGVDLSWTDNSDDEAGFDVEYRTGGGAWTTVATTEPNSTSWRVGNLAHSTDHDFRVVARNAAGSAESNVATRTTGPAAPSNLRAERTGGKWRLHWRDNSNDEVEFDVYYQTSADEAGDTWSYSHSPVRDSTSTDTSLTGQNYFFVMFAYIDSARASSPGNVVAVGSLPRPAVPQNLAAVAAGSTNANVSWRDNSTNEGGFRVERRRLAAGQSHEAWTSSHVAADATSAELAGLTASATYEFRVTSFFQQTDTASSSLSSSTTFTMRMPPAAPTGLSATLQSTNAELAWTDNASHETGFKVEFRERGTSSWTLSSTAPSDTTSATVAGLTTGTDYEFRVVASNANGDSTPSNVASTAPAGPPAAPSAVAVSPSGSTSATVSWNDNSSDETGFDVEHRTAGGAWAASTVAPDSTSASITALTASTPYEFRVSAKNSHGSTPSATVSRTMPPAAPSGLEATAADLTSVSLSWTDESTDETGFVVQYRLETATTWSTFGAEVAADADSATITGLTAGTVYEFRVLAKHASNGQSSPSNVATASTPGPPSAASGLAATGADSTGVDLSWTDNSDDEAGFDVEYRTGGGAWTTVATTEPNSTSWRVGNLAHSTDHDFRVVARNAAGSAESNVATRTTGPAAPSNLRAERTGGKWRLHWRDNSNDEVEFDVYYQTSADEAGDTWSYSHSPVRDSTSTDTSLTGQNYFFVMFAYIDSARASSPGNVVAVGSLPRPAVPQNLAAVAAGSTNANVSWRDNSTNEGGFRVERRKLAAGQSPGAWTSSHVAADATSTELAGLTASATYEFRVTAFFQQADTASSSLSSSTTFTMRMPPEAPTGLSATLQSTNAELAWTDNASHETGFKVEFRERGTSSWTLSSATPSDTSSATVPGLNAGTDYEFRVVASNANGDSTPSNVASTAPVALTIAGLANATVAENAAWTSPTPTVAGHRGAAAWTVSGADAGDFTIDGATGVLSMVARDHEAPADADADNVYEVTATATDEDGITGSVSIAVTVTDVNEAPVFAAATTLAISVPEGTAGEIGPPATATDPEGAALAYGLAGTDAASFEVSSTGQISLAPGTVLNYERKSNYAFSVVAGDGASPALTAARAVTVTVTDVDEALTIAGLANASVAENAAWTSPTPTVAGHRGAAAWTVSGADAADFTIDGATGVLSMVARDHEAPADADADNVYEVTATATDEDGITGSVSITVTVTDVNEAPVFAAATTLAITVPEGTAGDIGPPVTATDPEGAALAYRLAGTDAASFEIASTGQISLAPGTVLNYERKSDYAFSVVASDGASPALTAARAVTVTVTDVDEALTIAGLANATVAENAAWTSPTPTVAGHRGAAAWTRSGADAADFAIDGATGALSMVARDHEAPADADADNVYEVTATATDEDGITGSVSIAVTVTDVNEAPVFAAATTLAISVPEGTAGEIGPPATATDPEGAALAYGLAGTDAASFEVSSTGQISLAPGTVLNYERKSNYAFSVVAGDGASPALTAARAVTVTVTDVDEALTIAGLANASVAENAAWTSPTPTVAGHRGAAAWTRSGADAGDFAIDGATGVLSMVARDHEAPADADADNVYEVTATATDEDGITGSVSITVTVTDVNEAPVFAAATTLAITVPEGTAGDIGPPVTATDPEGAALAYRLAGTDAASFEIASTGQISLAPGTVLNYERKSDYAFSVVASDGASPALTAARAVTVTVTDVDEALTIAGLANATVAENAAWTSPTPTVAGHRGAAAWTRSGADAADFAIDGATGALSMVARDHEAPADADADNVYEVTATATDEDGITGSVSIAVTVTDVNEAPVFAAATTLAISVPEGTAGEIGPPATATDPEGAALAYGLAGTDAASFDISSTGQISLAPGTVLNYERKSNYAFSVVAGDGASPALTAARAVTVTVTDVDEALTIAGLANASVAENAAWTSPTPTVAGHRGAAAWTVSGADAADFTIDGATGVLSMVARDHEAPADADADNVYEVTATATDEDGITGSVSIAIAVTDVNEAPVFAAATTLAISVPEGTAGDIGPPATATDPEGAALAYSLAGTDAASFEVSSTGQISLAPGTVLNYERKSNYAFSVVAGDGASPALTAARAVTVTVTDVDEALTIAGLANASVAENAAWTSPTPTVAGHRGAAAWTRSGADAGDFAIDGATGVLSMVARDHEAPADADADNVYEVTATATDEDGITGSVSIAIAVTDVNEAPVFAAATTLAISVPEGTAGDIGPPATATDPEGAALAYGLAGTDAASFDIDTATGQLSVRTAVSLDYETRRSYRFSVVAGDGGAPPLTATRQVEVEVTDIFEPVVAPPPTPETRNRPPEFRPATPLAISVPEDVAGDVGAPVTAADPDGDDLTYSLAGEGATPFGIDPETGQIAVGTGTDLDYERRPFHVFAVVASDGALTASREVAVLVIGPDGPAPPTAPNPPDAPAAPTGLDAALIASTAVLLTWTDNSDDEAGFVILHRTAGEDWSTLRSLPANAETATIDGLEPGVAHDFLVTAVNAAGSAPSNDDTVSLALAPPTHLDSAVTGPVSARLVWRDNSVSETGFAIQYRNESSEQWTSAAPLRPNATSTSLDGLEPGSRYLFRVGAASRRGIAFSQPAVFTLLAPPEPGTMTDCVPGVVAATLGGGYDARMCFETPSGAQMDSSNYHLEATASGLLYFFERDNVEVLLKVLDGCAINGHRWVFVAPVTTLAFNLEITEQATGRRFLHRNPKSLTAQPRSDTAAFPCDPRTPTAAAAFAAAAGDRPDEPTVPVCEPEGPGIVLEDGHRVDICFALPDGEIEQARDWGLPRRSAALLHFFDRENAEVLVKVLDGCTVNGYRWVFAAPVTTLAFNLVVTAPDGRIWTHRNAAGATATPAADAAAFECD